MPQSDPDVGLDMRDGSLFDHLFGALAAELSRFDAIASALLEELDPRSTALFIAEWESQMDLPRACQPTPSTLALQRAIVVSLLTRGADLSPATLIEAATLQGYAITIKEYFPETVPGDLPLSNRFRYHVTATGTDLVLFKGGQSVSGDYLGKNEQTDIACLLDEIQPGYATRTGV